MAKKKQLKVHAIRRNKNGTISKKTFHGTSWANLAPLIVMDQFGQTKKVPKQGWEQVPEGWTEEAPPSLDIELLQSDYSAAAKEVAVLENSIESIESTEEPDAEELKAVKAELKKAKTAATKAKKALEKAEKDQG